jgi:hypothetical protein
MRLTPYRRSAKRTGNLTSQRPKRRCHSASSSSSDESQRSSGLVASREKVARPPSRSAHSCYQRRPRLFPTESSEQPTSDVGKGTDILQGSGNGGLILANQASRSDPKPVRSPTALLETEETPRSNSDNIRLDAEDGATVMFAKTAS